MVLKFVHYSYLFIIYRASIEKKNGRSMAAVYNGGKVSIRFLIISKLTECSRMHCRFHLDVILGANQISQWQGARFEGGGRCKTDRWRRIKQLSSRHLHLSSALRTKSIEHGREYKVTLLLNTFFSLPISPWKIRRGEGKTLRDPSNKTEMELGRKNSVFRCTISSRKQIHI